MNAMGMGICPPFRQRVYECAPGILCEQDIPVKWEMVSQFTVIL